MRHFWPVLILVCALHDVAAADPRNDVPAGTVRRHATELRWQPGSASLPAGVETVVLEGDPRAAGLFSMRLRAPAGTRLAPHTHPRPERVTVLSGAIAVGFGRQYDPARLHVFGAGDYYANPPQEPHFVEFIEASVIQVTAEGPWALDFVSP